MLLELQQIFDLNLTDGFPTFEDASLLATFTASTGANEVDVSSILGASNSNADT